MILRLSKLLLLLVCLYQFQPTESLAKVLAVPLTVQEQDQWCWAGSSAAVLAYYGTPVAQCNIAEYTRLNATWHNFGSVNCCTNPNQGCNYWNYNWYYAGSIEDILSHWGVGTTPLGSALSLIQSTDEITGNRPFIIRWGWTTGGGHFVIGHGVEGNTMYYMNPWPGEGMKIADYNWVVFDGSHTWTHSQTTTIPVYTINASVQAGSGTVTCDTPVSRGDSSVCGITESMGYLLSSFTDDGFDKLSSVTNNSYVITNVIANHIITASFSDAPRAKVGANVFTSLQLAYNDSRTNTGSEIKLLEGSR